jgi:hypothetical protein
LCWPVLRRRLLFGELWGCWLCSLMWRPKMIRIKFIPVVGKSRPSTWSPR